jgi:hypothetical protein
MIILPDPIVAKAIKMFQEYASWKKVRYAEARQWPSNDPPYALLLIALLPKWLWATAQSCIYTNILYLFSHLTHFVHSEVSQELSLRSECTYLICSQTICPVSRPTSPSH